MFGLGGQLAKEVAFVFMFCYYFVQAYFVMFIGLLGSLSIKVLLTEPVPSDRNLPATPQYPPSQARSTDKLA